MEGEKKRNTAKKENKNIRDPDLVIPLSPFFLLYLSHSKKEKCTLGNLI
jgi:hypothetical protein